MSLHICNKIIYGKTGPIALDFRHLIMKQLKVENHENKPTNASVEHELRVQVPLFMEECSRHHVRSSSPQTSPSDKGTTIPFPSTRLSIFPRTMKTIFSMISPAVKISLPSMYVLCRSLSRIASKIGS